MNTEPILFIFLHMYFSCEHASKTCGSDTKIVHIDVAGDFFVFYLQNVNNQKTICLDLDLD